MKINKRTAARIQYHLDEQGCFVVENYNHSKAFSNFFPGVAGEWGIPMWVFYVNRGQCVCSFGIESKDKSILEFQPANKAYRTASLQGFRTFFKITDKNKQLFWEPFQNNTLFSPYESRQHMAITAHDLTIEDVNSTLGLKTAVNYFTMPQEDFPALVRQVTVTNLSSRPRSIEMMDGLPVIVPYGINEWALKNMSRTVEAWIKVKNLEKQAPFFHLNVEIADRPDVRHIQEGNFYFSFEAGKEKLLPVAVEAWEVFGNSADFRTPEKFLNASKFTVPESQQTSNRMPCAMSVAPFKLAAGSSKSWVTLVGHAQSLKHLQGIVKKATAKGFIETKAEQNRAEIEKIKALAFTHSASPEFDLYSGQNFLDNVLRGGLPVTLPTGSGPVTFNVYSRKHGDLERDYNYFVLAATPFSQGNGNYRDVNQNRRCDVWINPDVSESSIVDFFNLQQADGYNPLVVKGLAFSVSDHSRIAGVLEKCVRGDSTKLRERLKSAFQPGELLTFVQRQGITLKVALSEFLGQVLAICHKVTQADHGEGFWIDHWTYNIDLVESFLAIYPERLNELFLEKREFSFYHNSHYVLPRSERYLLTADGVRQYHSVKDAPREIHADAKGIRLRTRGGEGEVYHTNLLGKFLCLLANKAATLDPSGIGIEMEADKPGWCDSLNGLPGLLGSSTCETLEVKRYALFLLERLAVIGCNDNTPVALFEELADFIRSLHDILQSAMEPLAYWNKANEAKEHYRARVRLGISGAEQSIAIGEVKEFLQLIINRVDQGIAAAKDDKGLIATYVFHEVTEYAATDRKAGEYVYVIPRKFKLHRIPLFLEGFVHYLRCEKDPAAARELFKAVQQSGIFDKKLRMYKICADLTSQSEGIGRMRVFPRGWLENESIWLHMEYKYLLELLRREMYEEFFATFRDVLVPFLPPEKYGRSTLENSSFIVSSAHEDSELHGQGFVARLSGSTAEFLHIWLWMNAGKTPFGCYGKGEIMLQLAPVLPGWLFSKKSAAVRCPGPDGKTREINLPANTYAFMFLGKILTVYHNPSRRDTFRGLKIKGILLTYPGQKTVKIDGSAITMPYSKDVRDRKVERMDVYFD